MMTLTEVRNPYENDLALANSNYTAYQNNKLVRILEPQTEPTALAEFVHDSFRNHVLNPKFSCVAAKSAINRGQYRFGIYNDMSSKEATAGLARDLFCFVQEQKGDLAEGFATFVASFAGPNIPGELEFEGLLWGLLQNLHDLDSSYYAWDATVSADPQSADFSFSFGGQAFFIVGLFPGSSRWTRRFAWPTLIFNAHHQFERLREEGKYERMQSTIRAREHTLQGTINPNLADFGKLSEARQYSGRPVEAEWRCPFHPRTGNQS